MGEINATLQLCVYEAQTYVRGSLANIFVRMRTWGKSSVAEGCWLLVVIGSRWSVVSMVVSEYFVAGGDVCVCAVKDVGLVLCQGDDAEGLLVNGIAIV